ncbi:hypothetical protein ACFPJ1_16920 [Kribbella qitaiheensis]|uniref:hypothetical protein n=1 Tax=Kribbella qitaiheensis TaxID=1544730 RepID=UPI003608FB5E
MSFPWIRTAAAAAVVALIATGCDGSADTTAETPATTSAKAPASTPVKPPAGLESQPVRTIMKKTRLASLAASNLRMRGTIDDTSGPMTFDITWAKGGGQGNFTVAGVPYSVRAIGKTVCFQLSEAAIRAEAKAGKSSAAETAQMLRLLKNKWIKLSKVDKDTQEMVDLVTPGRFFKTVFGADDTDTAAAPRKAAPRMVDGVRCVGLTEDGASMWIDATTAQMIRMTDGKNRFHFSDYGKVPAPKAPAKSQVLDGKAMGL